MREPVYGWQFFADNGLARVSSARRGIPCAGLAAEALYADGTL